MKTISLFCAAAVMSLPALADRFAGLWTTIDDESKEKKSVVRVYVHDGLYYGRVVKLLKNPDAVAKLPGSPKIVGLDIIWRMKKDDEGKTLTGGRILDPKKGRVYSCEMWRKNENLIVRGKIAFLGRNQTWVPATESDLPTEKDLPAPVPVIPVK